MIITYRTLYKQSTASEKDQEYEHNERRHPQIQLNLTKVKSIVKSSGLIVLTVFMAVQVPAQETKLLWADVGDMSETGGKIKMSNLDGSGLLALIDSLFFPAGIAVDNSCSPPELYIAERGKDRILKMQIGDTTMQEVITGIPGIYDIELDLNLRKVFWISNTYSLDAVSCADMDGLNSNIEDKYVSNSTGYDYTGLAIDPANEKIFWVRRDNGCEDYIYKMNYDKTGFQYLIEYPANKLIGPWDIDLYEGSLYWTDCGLAEDIIYKADTDGSGIDTVIRDVNTLFFVIDSDDSKIYWNDDDVIGCSNLDGTGRDTLFNGLGDFIYGMAIAYNVQDTIQEPEEPEEPQELAFGGMYSGIRGVKVYPVPVRDNVTLEYTLAQPHEISVQLFDLQGRMLAVLLETGTEKPGTYFKSLTIPEHLKPGQYILLLTGEGESAVYRILKQDPVNCISR